MKERQDVLQRRDQFIVWTFQIQGFNFERFDPVESSSNMQDNPSGIVETAEPKLAFKNQREGKNRFERE